MVNRHRGETALMVEGQALPMRLTLGALAELEHAFAVDSLPALGQRFIGGHLSARDIIRIIAAGLRGAGKAIRDEDVAGLPFDGGLAGAIKAAIGLLEATFGDGEARPPQPPEA
ncbi:gene transfer agent family protein [Bosea sp. TND4EK4]|uniref:gene transfer agent family protein n=1 Tax=Bosea sp. TND4EK4 TaxID=1907408 RepID=UPI000954E06C|nr:gene transfer agent family protein [Bosea sp. TND4EK4]SIQ01641.1 Phage tail tube protein, GTA-gp10 [Bosea sp. TND4EK4]